MVLGACDRPPSGNIEAFTNKIQEILNAYKGTDKYLYIAGDFNLDLLKHSSKLLIQVFMDTMISYALLPLITKPTRVTPTSKTLIDNVFSNNFVNSPASYIVLCDISDHLPLITSINVTQKTNEKEHFFTRCLSSRDLDIFSEKCYVENWPSIMNSSDAQVAYSICWIK